MRQVTDEEYKKTKRRSEGKYGPVKMALLVLKVGEHLLIEKNDWQTKTPPFHFINRIGKKNNLKLGVETMVDGSGWMVTRIS